MKHEIINVLFLCCYVAQRQPIVAQQECVTKLDMIFILDSSGSIGSSNYQTMLDFVEEICGNFDVGADRVRIGAMIFSDSTEIQFHLNTYYNLLSITTAVSTFPYTGRGTNTGQALQLARTMMFVPENGDRPDVPNLAIVITDGQSDVGSATIQEAQNLREHGVKVIAVGVGSGVDIDELNAIASDPDDEYVLQVGDFSQLQNIASTLSIRACLDIDECLAVPGPCARTGSCSNTVGSYICNCQTGYGGSDCGTDIDECAAVPGPCASTGTCSNTVGSYTCNCQQGYEGADCGTDIDECASVPGPCASTGTCSNTIGSYTCICHPGYEGADCGTDINECAAVPSTCASTGTCSNTVGSYTCDCHSGYEGSDCGIDIDECVAVPGPCASAGTCSNTVGSYTCDCQPGYEGSDCGIDIDECVAVPGPCASTGTCSNTIGSYTCNCQPGYEGAACGTDINECATVTGPCTSAEICYNTVGSYKCDCQPGYEGTDCDKDIDECAVVPVPCASTGTCSNTLGSYTCNCQPGYESADCSTDIDECQDHNGGCEQFCDNYAGGFTCSCQYGYFVPTNNASHCVDVDECTESPCANSCQNTEGSYRCSCDLGYITDSQGNCRAPLLHYGTSAGDTPYTGVDDGCADPITFPAKMPFFGRMYSTLYPCTNGVASLEQYYTNYNPSGSVEFYSKYQYAILAPLHTDIDCRNHGIVYYNSYDASSSNKNIATVERYIRQMFNIPYYSVEYMVTITWHEVPRYPGYSGRPTATFQMALVTDWTTTHVVYIYAEDQMNWDLAEGSPRSLIGFIMDRALENDIHILSFSPACYRMDQYAESNGIKGIIAYRLADDNTKDTRHTRCNSWYNALKEIQVIQRPEVVQCPCTLQLLEEEDFFYEVMETVAQTRCFVTWPRWRTQPNAMKCCYDRTNSWIGRDNGPGGFIFYHPSIYSLLYNKYDLRPKLDCCAGQTSFCHLYRELRPVGQCFRQTSSNFAGLFGDPHILTMDGQGYTFNGWGEYTLLHVNTSDAEFVLQGRTGRAVTLAGITTDATIFEAFAARDHTNASIHVEIDETKSGLIVYGDGIEHTIEYNNNNRTFNYTGESLVLNRVNKTLKIIFTAVDISLTISVDIGMLRISLRVDNNLRGQTTGLLGNFDEDPDNDYRFPNGTLLNQNSTEREIFFFGQSWMVSEDASLFRYFDGLGPSDYRHPDFIPLFMEDLDKEAIAKATQSCGGEKNTACIYDLVLTGNLDVAIQTNMSDTVGRRSIAVSNNAIPILNSSRRLKANIGQELTAQVEAIDEGAVEFTLTGNAALSNVTADSVTITWKADTSSDVPISVTGTDSLGMSSPALQFEVVLCDGCSGHGYCDYTVVVSVDTAGGSFPMAQCVCDTADGIPIWTGLSCDVDFDGCTSSPCSISQECTDLDAVEHQQQQKSHQCGPCPDGYEDDGTKCSDIDECAGAHDCDQVCINTDQGYTCTCHTGYRQIQNNPKQCEDVNECDEAVHDCEHKCTNIPGSYTCSCFAGYLLDGNTTCVKDGNADDCALIGKDCNSTAGCMSESGTPECFCVNGYELTADGIDCTNIDECQRNVCTQKCRDTVGGYACSCYAGYKLQDDGVTCQECDSFHWGINCANLCSCGRGVASCDRVHGCVCRTGWTGSTCNTDIDECQTTPSLCSGLHQVCENGLGSFYCACEAGYQMTKGGQCEDIDECSDSGLNECQQECSNTPGSFVCSCRAGYIIDDTVSTQCTDLDECEAGISTCEQICENVKGKFNCYCDFGYVLNTDRVTCRKVQDLCATHGGVNCSDICVVDQTSVSCGCPLGYELGSDSQTCKDIDECSSSALNKCSYPNLCTNLLGGYQCRCPTGQFLQNDKRSCKVCDAYHYGENCAESCDCGQGADHCDPVLGCMCRAGWLGQKCDIDLDECAGGPDTCPGEHTMCKNYAGGFSCQCWKGYQEDASGECIDLNECISPLSNMCDQICVNTNGSIACQCQPGFLYADGRCRDIDECSGPHDCNHICHNTVGSYRCSCDGGYRLDLSNRIHCIAIDECSSTQQELCHGRNADCVILNVQPTCACWKGYQVDTNTEIGCEDIKECEQDPSPCDHVCVEQEGGYSCSCRAGFQLDNDKRSCKECNDGRWGIKCSRTCNCSAASLPGCNKTTGNCMCQPGYHGPFCDEDDDECSDNSVSCPDNSECVNTLGSYRCECHDGYLTSADSICSVCPRGHWGPGCSQTCSCHAPNTDTCNHVDGTCTCKPGWIGEDCTEDDIDCSGVGPCDDNEICAYSSTVGSYTCLCKTGYISDENGGCIDVDECRFGLNDCHEDCVNTNGGFTCSCNSGFRYIVNECLPCPDNTFGANCIGTCVCNTTNVLNSNKACEKSSGACICKPEWRGAECNDDVDECVTGTHNCDGTLHRTCRNNEGGYECVCSDGYQEGEEENACTLVSDSFTLRPGIIIGVSVIGGVVVLAAVISAVVIYRCRIRSRHSRWSLNWREQHRSSRTNNHSSSRRPTASSRPSEQASDINQFSGRFHEPERAALQDSWTSQSFDNKMYIPRPSVGTSVPNVQNRSKPDEGHSNSLAYREHIET